LLANEVSMTTAADESAEKTITTGTKSPPSFRSGTDVTNESEKPIKLGRTGCLVWARIFEAPASKTSNCV
jgi:hypothetical protein